MLETVVGQFEFTPLGRPEQVRKVWSYHPGALKQSRNPDRQSREGQKAARSLMAIRIGCGRVSPSPRPVQVIRCLDEANRIRATVRITGVAKNTVFKLLVEAGYACAEFQDKAPDLYSSRSTIACCKPRNTPPIINTSEITPIRKAAIWPNHRIRCFSGMSQLRTGAGRVW